LSRGKPIEPSLQTTMGWGLFFAWVGVVLLMAFSEGIGLLGVGVLSHPSASVKSASFFT